MYVSLSLYLSVYLALSLSLHISLYIYIYIHIHNIYTRSDSKTAGGPGVFNVLLKVAADNYDMI